VQESSGCVVGKKFREVVVEKIAVITSFAWMMEVTTVEAVLESK